MELATSLKHLQRPAAAAALFVAVALVTTWPLATGLSRDIPWDLGDPLLNCWILGWDASRFVRFLSGDIHALSGFWDANIFYPEPLTLAYSDHLIPQALQVLPIYAFTHNVILAYNVVFLSTFVLSALGGYLLVRDLTGSPAAGLVGGLLYGFAPYRVEQSSHVQVLSAQWMPFVLLAVRRFLAERRTVWLVGAAVVLVVQNLSCGYYLLFFPPFVAAWALWEMAARGLVRDRGVWILLTGAFILVAAATAPFVLPYAELHARGTILRPAWEVEQFSADVYAYLTAPENLRFWGERLRVYPLSEGSLFLGLVPLLLAGVGVGAGALRAWRGSRETAAAGEPARRWRRIATWGALALGILSLTVALAILGGGETLLSSFPGLRARSLVRPARLAALSFAAVFLLSPRARRFGASLGRAPFAFWLLALLLAAALSLGPTVRAMGEVVSGFGPYRLLYEHVPGFEGLRVPARFAMLVALFLSILGGLGAAELARGAASGGPVLAGLSLLFLLESNPAPIVLNDVWRDHRYRKPPPRVLTGDDVPPIYRAVASLPREAVLVEFPFGSEPWELRYMFYSLAHEHRLVNGMSGVSPPRYVRNRGLMSDPFREPEGAWRAVVASGATHVVVHEWAWRRGNGVRVSERLEACGARRLASLDGDVLLEVARP